MTLTATLARARAAEARVAALEMVVEAQQAGNAAMGARLDAMRAAARALLAEMATTTNAICLVCGGVSHAHDLDCPVSALAALLDGDA
jgi:hypothetical protein